LIDDEALAITPPDKYRAVIVPATTMIMEATATWLQKLMTAGGSVIMIDSTVQVPGASTVAAEELADAPVTAVTPDLEISPGMPDVGFAHRRCGDTEVYVVINTGPTTRTFRIAPRNSATSYERWNALSGQLLRAGAISASLQLTLHPYEATVIALTDQPVGQASTDANMRAEPVEAHPVPLKGPWQVAYGNACPGVC